MLRTKKLNNRRQHWSQIVEPKWFDESNDDFDSEKKSNEDSNEESDNNCRRQFRGNVSDKWSGGDADKEADENCDENFDEESYENEEDKKWDGFTDNSCADINFLQKMVQSFIFEQTAITEHQLAHFNAGLRNYQGLTQISSKVQASALKMTRKNQFLSVKLDSITNVKAFRESAVCYYEGSYR